MSLWSLHVSVDTDKHQVIYYKTTGSMPMEGAQTEARWAWAVGDWSQSSFPEGTNNWKISHY